jgi:hypothetical protein
MDYPSLYFSLTVRTLYQRRDRGLVWPGLAGAVFPPNEPEPLVDVLACTRVTEGARRGVQLVASVYGMPHVTASSACSAVSLRQPEGGAEVYGIRTGCAVVAASAVQPFFMLCTGRWVWCV